MHITHIQGSGSIVYFYIDGTLPQVGIDPPAQSEVCYQTTALPPSHHGWIGKYWIFLENAIFEKTWHLLDNEAILDLRSIQ